MPVSASRSAQHGQICKEKPDVQAKCFIEFHLDLRLAQGQQHGMNTQQQLSMSGKLLEQVSGYTRSKKNPSHTQRQFHGAN